MKLVMKAFLKHLIEAVYSTAITYMVGRWGTCMAYIERGYKAVGGEILLIPLTYLTAWCTIRYFINTLEELAYEECNYGEEK